MEYYKHEITVAELRTGEISDVIEAVRALAYPRINVHPVAGLGIEMPYSITVYWEVGHEDGIADLWDLRDAVLELEANLGVHLALSLGKPERVPDAEAVMIASSTKKI